MEIPKKVEVEVGETHVDFYPNRRRVGGLIAIGASLAIEAVIGSLYLMYSQPGTFEQDSRLGALAVAAAVGAVPLILGLCDLFRSPR